jgi:hypothetical protein
MELTLRAASQNRYDTSLYMRSPVSHSPFCWRASRGFAGQRSLFSCVALRGHATELAQPASFRHGRRAGWWKTRLSQARVSGW